MPYVMNPITAGLFFLLSLANGSISGKIVPEYTILNVSLARYTYDDNGEIQLLNFKTSRTSSEIGKFGEFRFNDVEPGEYFIYVNTPGLARKGETIPLTYYPGTDDLGRATKVVLPAGENIQLRDFNLFPVQTPSVQVRLVDATGIP